MFPSPDQLKTKYLFVCTANVHRSKTAEILFKKKMIGSIYQFKSCGVAREFIEDNRDSMTKDSVFITRELCEWADVILVMENMHGDWIKDDFGPEIRKKAYVLGIPDVYQFMQPDLCLILEHKVKFGLRKPPSKSIIV